MAWYVANLHVQKYVGNAISSNTPLSISGAYLGPAYVTELL